MIRGENSLTAFLMDNAQWLALSFLIAFGFWVLAVRQNDSIQEREFSRLIRVNIEYDSDMIVTRSDDVDDIVVTVRGPESVLNSLRPDQIAVVADLQGRGAGTHSVQLRGELAEGLRGEVTDISPRWVEIALDQLESRRMPIMPEITLSPPIGYAASNASCGVMEVTARGTATLLDQTRVVARLNLSEERNSLTLNVPLLPVNASNRALSGITLDPNQVECSVTITQQENVFELSVVPTIEGFPPPGYIYQGFDYNPKTIAVTGLAARVRELNGIVSTEPINLNGVTSSFERTVSVRLPEGVRLQTEAQAINVSITIGTIPGNRQFTNVPVTVSGLRSGLDAVLLPDVVTAFVVGPQPLLRELSSADIRVVVDVTDLGAGSYQRSAGATIIVAGLGGVEVTVQPTDINVSLAPIQTSVPGQATPELAPTPRLDVR